MNLNDAQKLAIGLEIIAAMKANAYGVTLDMGRIMTAEDTLPEHYGEGFEEEEAKRLAAMELLKLNEQAIYIAGITLAKMEKIQKYQPKEFSCVFSYINTKRYGINLSFEIDDKVKSIIESAEGVECLYTRTRYSIAFEIGMAFENDFVKANLEKLALEYYNNNILKPKEIIEGPIIFERMSEKRLQEVADIIAPKKTINYRALIIYATSFVIAIICQTLGNLMAGGTWIPTTPIQWIARILLIVLLTFVVALKIANSTKKDYRRIH